MESALDTLAKLQYRFKLETKGQPQKYFLVGIEAKKKLDAEFYVKRLCDVWLMRKVHSATYCKTSVSGSGFSAFRSPQKN